MNIKYLAASLLACTLFMGTSIQAQNNAATPKKVLLVTATLEFRHSCIPLAEKVLTDLGKTSGAYVIVDTIRSTDRPSDPDAEKQKEKVAAWQAGIKADFAAKMSAEALKKYDAVIFCNTTGNLPVPSMDDFLSWIKNGGNFIGMHAASDTFHASPAFIDMLGGEFKQHGPQVKVDCINQDLQHPATKHFGSHYEIFDEIYQFKNFHRERVHGLLTLDKHPNDKTPGDYPVSWCKQVGKGRVFYTSLGHREDVWESADYDKHILGGIKWALGLEPGDATPQTK